MSPRVEAIWLKRGKRAPMDAVARATALAGRGLVGNADQGGRRQVTLLERESWEAAVADVLVARGEPSRDVPPSLRRANVLVSGLALVRTRGRLLTLGGCTLRILGELTPCERMDEVLPGLQARLRGRWRAGAFAEVVCDGELAVGDAPAWALGALA